MSFSTTDLDLHVEVASLEAIDEMIEEASSPQAPYDSATMGTHTHPSSEHSLHCLLLLLLLLLFLHCLKDVLVTWEMDL